MSDNKPKASDISMIMSEVNDAVRKIHEAHNNDMYHGCIIANVLALNAVNMLLSANVSKEETMRVLTSMVESFSSGEGTCIFAIPDSVDTPTSKEGKTS